MNPTTKNISPNQLSTITSLILSVPVGAVFFIITKNWTVTLLVLLAFFLLSYFLIHAVLEWFIFRKIKLIYKLINQKKANKKEEMYYKYILPKKSIDDVRQDVENWAQQSKAEIEVLKNNEAYRKEFLQNLAHELKTPIFAIQGYVDTLLNGALENPSVNKRFLENASHNIERMVNLVSDLDEISKLENGTQPVNKQNFIIQYLIKDVFEALSIKSAKKEIKCTIKKGCEHPVSVFADKEKIRQVLINLVDNAIKYGKKGGNVIASVYKTDGKNILIEISDDGIGIPEEHVNRIFERFYRIDSNRSRDIGGTGLGLAICKHIIEAHFQTIHVRSKLNVGTTIGFTLSAKESSDAN